MRLSFWPLVSRMLLSCVLSSCLLIEMIDATVLYTVLILTYGMSCHNNHINHCYLCIYNYYIPTKLVISLEVCWVTVVKVNKINNVKCGLITTGNIIPLGYHIKIRLKQRKDFRIITDETAKGLNPPIYVSVLNTYKRMRGEP